ncbi:DeoR/GlpR family DNA-binding transcription regulator [Nonomuraea muscovyensis]|jgi:DeoR family transcriptional regulator of aga operon|uniref:DeoR family transcriptional regulator of aga operon n=1 Tax=Nonomuraea muscovyensis TaxID=1124761 RepID=A0A7X0EZU1_9ACTN|nr:DeoR/GlpR family DNA-binding transcription regulator [Nonomuraea muscovyensis]MBB6347046.1 DeoR family transcriptional regulator of aga operon [Nonomuraea muscovyensis]MDF2707138.1 DeoR family transcriptional regulator [Nonomuraea muscovyensis]
MSESMPTEVRRERMLGLLVEQEFARVAELAEVFGVSTVTVRADLDALEEQGKVRRVRGGAVAASPPPRGEPSFELSLGAAAVEKALIARAAARLVGSGESVLMGAGTTTAYVARELVARPDLTEVTVFTNGLRTALELEPALPRFAVVVTGGSLRRQQHSLVDPLGGKILEGIRAHTVFVGCGGVHPEAGVTNVNLPDAEMKQRMLRAAARRIVVADSSKLGRVEMAPVCALSEVDLLITGEPADPETVESLRERGLKVEIAGR